ncbi:aldehyde dehydrogenase [Pilatotrama ljubarskyi]|nr:aldehyde dehydrogenase [Pilatotrama ljubarskyi]
MALPFTPLYIDGQWRPASTGVTFDVHNPNTRKVIGKAAAASAEDCAAAVQAAARAFKTWENSPLSMRRDILLKASDILATKEKQIATAIREETSATEDWLWANHGWPVEQLRDVASSTALLRGETAPSIIPGGQTFIQRRAIGPVLSIVPWNAPVILTLRAVAVPIVCGNTVILKTHEVSPRSQAIIVEAFAEAGLPNGVLNCISASREDSPARTTQIIASPQIRKVNFTGSDAVGKLIAQEAARYLKPCVLELGGKAPVVVLDDADIPRAARAIASSALLHSGQICMSTERVIVQRGAADALLEQLTSLFKRIKAGDPHVDRTAHIAAMFNPGSTENAIGLLKDALKKGAKLLTGDLSRQGAVMQPHLVVDVKPGMQLWDRETFAPVTVVAVVDTIDEAVDLANASDYSLISGIWTRDVHKAFDVASRIRASTNNINGPTVHVELVRENGGLGGSTGYGVFMVEDWTQLRMIVLHPEQEPPYPITAKL